ncbi:MAG: PD40 domain-containing protein, partial [Candidatus Latescibacteria bacterium]|nr:PD40 domain-containing protein [Candidatus Latescibacterota bacterium]
MGISEMPRRWSFITYQRRWWFPRKLWRIIQEEAAERDTWIQIKGLRQKTGRGIQASKPVHFRISRWPADNAIVYRLVAPPFVSRKTPDTFVRDIRSFQVRTFLSGRRSYCFNCHTFSSKTGTGGKMGIQSRYMAGGSYELPVYFGVYDIDEKRGVKLRLPFDIQMTTYMGWSPDGNKLALSANQQLVTLSPVVLETQFAGEPTSVIAIYDLSHNIAYLLPGASDPDLLEMYPCWSRDGESIVYCSAPAGTHPAQVKYDLWVVPFNEGKGGVSRTIPGASHNGKSNYFPRYSPDGRWLCFCESDGGCLIKSSSDLYLLPGDLKGEAHRLECNAEYAADSWHS